MPLTPETLQLLSLERFPIARDDEFPKEAMGSYITGKVWFQWRARLAGEKAANRKRLAAYCLKRQEWVLGSSRPP